jgi:hypothetical protein
LFLFTSPESEAVAVGDVVDESSNADSADLQFTLWVNMLLLPGPTDALLRHPVARDELEPGQVRSVREVKPRRRRCCWSGPVCDVTARTGQRLPGFQPLIGRAPADFGCPQRHWLPD